MQAEQSYDVLQIIAREPFVVPFIYAPILWKYLLCNLTNYQLKNGFWYRFGRFLAAYLLLDTHRKPAKIKGLFIFW